MYNLTYSVLHAFNSQEAHDRVHYIVICNKTHFEKGLIDFYYCCFYI